MLLLLAQNWANGIGRLGYQTTWLDLIPPQPFFAKDLPHPPVKQELPLKPSGFTTPVHLTTAARTAVASKPRSAMR